MTLKEWWTDKGTLRELAAKLGLPATTPIRTVQRYVEHERIPDRALIRQIAEKTEGAVALGDWPDRPERVPKRVREAAQPVA